MIFEMEIVFKKNLMNNSAYYEIIKQKMSFGEKRDIFRIKNNSVYGKTTNLTFNNPKKYEAYKNELLG